MVQKPKIEAPYSEVNLTAAAFDHPEWIRANPIQITRTWSGADAPVSRHAEARIIWTEDSLIARFLCRQDEPLVVNANPLLGKKTMRLWDKDVCELFVAPDPTALEHYFEFEASPLGEWIDLEIHFTPAGRKTNFEFHSGMTTAALVAKGQTNIGMQIPWSASLPKPEKGDSWRVNLFRCIGIGDERYLAWRPTYAAEPSFHVPEAFGWLNFL